MFKDRNDAGEQLAEELKDYTNNPDALVVAIPRGGVVPGAVIAKKLGLPLELALVKKIGHPANPEYAIGAASLQNITLNRNADITDTDLYKTVERIRTELKRRTMLFYKHRKPASLAGKIVILTDDGVATGNTLLKSIELIRHEKPKQLIVAVPVGPPDTIIYLKKVADHVICLHAPPFFQAIGAFYENFEQVSDEEAVAIFNSVLR
ncbi:MAG: phosphoribosyltransferase [Bacteroidetes bacterium]|nr:phosphoribosyltransferase [Bacteroidota bacterium]